MSGGLFFHGAERTSLFGVYILPSEDDMSTMHMLAKELRGTHDLNIIVLRDLNINLCRPKDGRQWTIVDDLWIFALSDVSTQFEMRYKRQHWCLWRMWCEGRPVSAL